MQNKRISFHYIDVRFSFNQREKIKEFILLLFRKEGREVESINYIFCNDEYLFNLNVDYLNHDTLTDIITFYYSAPDQPVISDIYISVERVKENAEKFRTSFKNELMRVIFHGALHLCGHNDKTEQEQKLMREKEEFYLNLIMVPRGTMKPDL